MTCKKNIGRDAVVIIATALIAGSVIITDKLNHKRSIEAQTESIGVTGRVVDENMTEEEILQKEPELIVREEAQEMEKKIDTGDWESMSDPQYGLEVKYPKAWGKPKSIAGNSKTNWEYRFKFSRNFSPDDRVLGFEMVVYPLDRVKEFSMTDEFPRLKDESKKNDPQCQNIGSHQFDTGDYPAAEIYVAPGDACFTRSLFWNQINGKYIYNLVPFYRNPIEPEADLRLILKDEFPEIMGAVSTFKLIEIQKPKPAPFSIKKVATSTKPKSAYPKLSAPKPVSFKIVNGRMVFAKKNDKPSKSKKTNKKHLDMECCLDPDEYPNPWCYYDPGKYGKYLK